MPRPYPMGAGLETDMETGEPLEVGMLHRHARQEELRAQAEERHQRLLNDLGGKGGTVLREVAAQLAKRITHLIAADPEASTLMGLLEGMEQKVFAGEKIAQDALQKVFMAGGLTAPEE